MADTTQLKTTVEEWYRYKLIKDYPNAKIAKETVPLKWGGVFECDAVLKMSNEIKEVHCLSVSEYKTTSGSGGSGKLQKIKADALMLLGIDVPKRVLAFIGKTMYDKMNKEKQSGRFPKEIELVFVDTKDSPKITKLISGIRSKSIKEMTK